jgi:hypothetical protein
MSGQQSLRRGISIQPVSQMGQKLPKWTVRVMSAFPEDTVAKVENRTTPKISRKLIF